MEDDAALFYGERREYPVVALPVHSLDSETRRKAGPARQAGPADR